MRVIWNYFNSAFKQNELIEVMKLMSDIQILHMPQRFDFGFHKDFSSQYQAMLTSSQCKKLVMDFSRTEYLDSSALGMMVLLNKKAKAVNIEVSIKLAKGNTLEILKIANFDKLFKFE